MSRVNRVALIKEISGKRNSNLFSYICSTRINSAYEMNPTDVRYFYNHLIKIGKIKKLDLLLHSYGGDVTVPWRLVNLIREYATEFNVIVPLHAFSAATLTAMGADSIVMLPNAVLGPTDPSSNGLFNPTDGMNRLPINVEDITAYIDFVKEDINATSEQSLIESLRILSHSDSRVHPLALGAAKRGSKLAKKYAKDLLLLHMKDKTEKEKVERIVKTFGADLYAHDHPIGRQEAKKLGLKIIIEKPEVEELIWKLFEMYENDMNMNQVFDFIAEFKKIQPVMNLSVGSTVQPVTKTLPEIKYAVIESEGFTDTHKREYDVTALQYLDNQGNIKETYSWILKSALWQTET